jgi:hypothetical protein
MSRAGGRPTDVVRPVLASLAPVAPLAGYASSKRLGEAREWFYPAELAADEQGDRPDLPGRVGQVPV